jgi:hypothetical protein
VSISTCDVESTSTWEIDNEGSIKLNSNSIVRRAGGEKKKE